MFKITLVPFGDIDLQNLINEKTKISHILLVFIINLNNLLTALENSIVKKVDNKIITSIEVKIKL